MAAPTDAALVKKVLANSEPSTHGPSRHLVASHQIRRYRSEAEVDPTPNPAHQVEIGPQQTSTMRSSRLRLARVRLLSAWRTQLEIMPTRLRSPLKSHLEIPIMPRARLH